MKRQRLPLHALRAFEAAAAKRNLVEAARELGVTHSAISHQLRLLEEVLGAKLFDRRHKPLRLTAAGERLLMVVADSFDRLSRVAAELKGNGIAGDLTVSCVPGLGTNWLLHVLGEFAASHTQVSVRMTTEIWLHPAASEEADLAIAYGSAEHPGKRVVLLGHSEFYPVCSPRLAAGLEPLVRAADLLKLMLLHEHNDETWLRWFVAAGVADVSAARGMFFDGAHLSLQAARAGLGVAMGDTPTVAADLRDGRLVRLFSLSVPATHPYYLITPPLDRMQPAARALEALILERFHELQKQA